MSIPRFVARFLGAFALLVLVGGPLHLVKGYASLLERAVSVAGPAVTGWWVESRHGPREREIWLRKGPTELKLQLSLEKLGLGLFPLLSLLIATPKLGWKRYGATAAAGTVLLFALDLGIVIAFPWLVAPGIANEVTGTFLGILTFVASPVILWFVLTFDRLRPVWRLG